MKVLTFLIIILFNLNIINAQVDSKAIRVNNEAYELFNQGRYKEAIVGFNNAINIDSSYYLFYQNRALSYSLLMNDSSAIKDYKTALRLNPDIADMFYSIANIYQKKNLFEEAYNNYTLAINTALKNNDTSNLYIYYFNRGNNLLETEKYKESIVDFDSTEKAKPNFNDLYQNRGIAEYKIDKLEDACIDWSIASSYDYSDAEKYFNKNCKNVDLTKFKIMPKFQGGTMDFKRYIAENVIYPAKSRENGEEGVVFLRFQINEKADISILDAFSFAEQDLITEAIKVVLSTKGQWTSGSIKKKKIKVSFSIPITFMLNSRDNNNLYKKKAYQFFDNGNYIKAKEFLHNYLRWNYDTTAVKDYIKIKYLLNDTADVEYYKYIIGKSNKKPDYIKKYSNQFAPFNGFPKNLNHKSQKKPNEVKTLYYNKKYELSSNKDASIYRISTWNPNIFFFDSTFFDYNKKNYLIQTGSYSKGYKEGVFKIFYNDTNVLYAEGEYKKNKMTGFWKYYNKKGQLKDEILIFDNEFKIISHFSEIGDTLINVDTGIWTYTIKSWDGKNDMYVSGNLINGMKDGLWTIKNEKKIIVEENYKNGIFINGKFYKKKKGIKTSESLISPWIFINPGIERMEKLLISDDAIKKEYSFILFVN